MKTKDLFKERKLIETSVVEMADAHCHLDLIQDFNVIKNSMDMGVKTIITNGVDRRSNMKSLQIADNRRIFAALGVDPEHSAAAGDDELEEWLKARGSLSSDDAERWLTRLRSVSQALLRASIDELEELRRRRRYFDDRLENALDVLESSERPHR